MKCCNFYNWNKCECWKGSVFRKAEKIEGALQVGGRGHAFIMLLG